MKVSLALSTAAIMVASSEAFAPRTTAFQSRTSSLMAQVDSTDLVKEALEISKKFGSSSREARLAWEAVEEVNASDNR